MLWNYIRERFRRAALEGVAQAVAELERDDAPAEADVAALLERLTRKQLSGPEDEMPKRKGR